MLLRAGLAGTLAVVLASCPSSMSTKPSILLFVFDTVRADAVSAYGPVPNTTPELDALAATGLRYTTAYANAPWTLPSHVTLFTGLLVHQHGVGSQTLRASAGLVMLAERLAALGYETVGFSENPFVSETFNLTKGFERFGNRRGALAADGGRQQDAGPHNLGEFVAAWLRERKRTLFGRQRPFFLFVNVMDAHAPYAVRAENPFVPVGVDAEAMRAMDRHVNRRICSHLPSPQEIDILRGLYLGGVQAADGKLKAVRNALREAGVDEGLVTIATSDHGELFGEHRLLEHQFSVHEALLRVPLVVAGLPGVQPATIEEPVQLADVVPSVLRWIGAEVPPDLAGQPLPTQAGVAPTHRELMAEHTDNVGMPDPDYAPAWLRDGHEQARTTRQACGAEDRVFGDMVALIRYPLKLVWYERYPAALYDLAADPDERSDLATVRSDLVAALRPSIDAVLARASGEAAPGPANLPANVQEHLRVLGYLGGPDARGLTPVAPPP
jgi:arylsulfatase A-like enzyme